MAAVSAVIQLIFVECILSIDNAAVMGAMVAHLPNDEPTPWPSRLQRLGRRLDRLLGPQRTAALRVGMFGAYAGRVLMLVLVSVIVRITWVQVLGALYLVHLGTEHFVQRYRRERWLIGNDTQPTPFRHRRGFWEVVLALNLVDMAFSLDNVVAAVALSDRLWVVIVGVGLGIVVIRFAATLFTKLIAWEPQLESGAYLLLLAIGSELLLDKLLGVHTDDLKKFGLSLVVLLLAVTFARVRCVRPLLAVFRPMLAMLAMLESGVALVFSTAVGQLRARVESARERSKNKLRCI